MTREISLQTIALLRLKPTNLEEKKKQTNGSKSANQKPRRDLKASLSFEFDKTDHCVP